MKKDKESGEITFKSSDKFPKKIKLKIAFCPDYLDIPDEVEISMTEQQVNLLMLGMALAKIPSVFNVNMECICEVDIGDFRVGVDYFMCYKNAVYYYAQSKYDTLSQIESAAIYFEDNKKP